LLHELVVEGHGQRAVELDVIQGPPAFQRHPPHVPLPGAPRRMFRSAHPETLQPPSTGRTTPVTNLASSEARYRAAAATSSGAPKPPVRGCLVRISSTISGVDWARRLMGVRMSPGASALTRMP